MRLACPTRFRHLPPIAGLLAASALGLGAQEGAIAGSGWRESLAEHGVTVDVVYTVEVVRLVEGGVGPEEALLLDNLDLTVGLDTAAAGWWPGWQAFAYVLSHHGDDPSSVVGDLQATSNLEAEDSLREFELWYEQAFGDSGVSLLGGLHDLNGEFYTSDTAGVFFNSSFGIGPDVAANVPVSIFNTSTLGLRARWAIDRRWTALVAVYDGEPAGVDDNPSGLEPGVDPDDHGVMTIAELQHHHGLGLGGTLRLGAWHHGGETTTLDDGEAVDGTSGAYLTADQVLHREAGSEDQGLSGFLQLGWAQEDRSEVPFYLGAGLVWQGLVPGREADLAGLALNHVRRSDELPDAGAETVVELVYAAELRPGVTLGLDYQFVAKPGATDHDVDDAHVLAARLAVVLF